MKRPWSGQEEKTSEEDLPEFDPKNPLCPGCLKHQANVSKKVQILIFKVSNVAMGKSIQNIHLHLSFPMTFQPFWKMFLLYLSQVY